MAGLRTSDACDSSVSSESWASDPAQRAAQERGGFFYLFVEFVTGGLCARGDPAGDFGDAFETPGLFVVTHVACLEVKNWRTNSRASMLRLTDSWRGGAEVSPEFFNKVLSHIPRVHTIREFLIHSKSGKARRRSIRHPIRREPRRTSDQSPEVRQGPENSMTSPSTPGAMTCFGAMPATLTRAYRAGRNTRRANRKTEEFCCGNEADACLGTASETQLAASGRHPVGEC